MSVSSADWFPDWNKDMIPAIYLLPHLRQLNRHENDYDPLGWGGPEANVSVTQLRESLSKEQSEDR
jgi:hypothetical protein